MIALLRRRFLKLLAGFGGAVATGALISPSAGQAQTAPGPGTDPQKKTEEQPAKSLKREKMTPAERRKAAEQSNKKIREQHRKNPKPKKMTPAEERKAEEQSNKESHRKGKAFNEKRVEQRAKKDAARREAEQKAKEANAKKQKKGGSLLEDERLKKERLARLIVERHTKA